VERIIYISTCRTEPGVDMVEDILRASRRNNRRDGLTGLLVVGGRRFLQVLEGPREMTQRAYERIRADQRHFALVELSRKHVTERSFAGWDMGCEQLDGDDLAELVHQLTEGLDDADLRAQFRSFVELHGKAA
jgi:hypothetical protein